MKNDSKINDDVCDDVTDRTTINTPWYDETTHITETMSNLITKNKSAIYKL